MVDARSRSLSLRASAGQGRHKIGGVSISSGHTAIHDAPHSGHWRNSSHSAASSTGQRMTLSSSRRNQSGRSAQGQSGFAGRGAGMRSRVPDNRKIASAPVAVILGRHVGAQCLTSCTSSASAASFNKSAMNRGWRLCFAKALSPTTADSIPLLPACMWVA